MSENLRDSAANRLNEALSLMQEGKCKEASKKLEQAEDASKKAEAYDIFLYTQTIKGRLMHISGAHEEALRIHSLTLKTTEELLSKDPDNKHYQSIFQMNLSAIDALGNLFKNMGLFIKAKYCYELNLSFSQNFSLINPENLAYHSYVDKALANLGNLLRNMGRIEEAKQRYEKALDIYEKLLKTDPENVAYKSYVGRTLNNLGILLFESGRIEEAKQRFEKTLVIREKLLKTDLENVKYKLEAARTLSNLGCLHGNMGRNEESKQRFEKALGICEKLLKTDPENVEYQSSVGETHNNFGKLLRNMGRFEEAKQKYEKALEMKEKLLQKDPENVEYQLCVAMALNNLGTLLFDMGRIEEAKQRYEKSLKMYEKLLLTDPENVAYQNYVGGILNNLGNLLVNIGRIEEAKQRFEKALETREKLLKTDPENVEYQSYVGTTLNNLGNLLRNTGHIEEAIQKCEKALEICEKLLQTDPQNVKYQSDIGGTLNNLGVLLFDTGRIEEAKQRYEKSLKIYEKLLQTDSENTKYQLEAALTLNNLGIPLFDMGLIQEAKQMYEKAFVICEKLLQADPENLEYQSYVGTTLNNLGDLLFNTGHIEEAKQRYEKALVIFTEPLIYKTISRKSNSIIRLIKLNTEQAEQETKSRCQIKYLKEAYKLCRTSQDFFSKYELKYERKLVMEAGLSAYLEYVIKDIKDEKDPEKKVEGYEKAIATIEKLAIIAEDEEVSKIATSSVRYLEGRKCINQAITSEHPNIDLIKQAVNQFKDAKETYDKANVYYCIYVGLLKLLEKKDIFEEKEGLKAKEAINRVIETLPKKTDPSIYTAFEEIAKIFDEKDIKNRKKHLEEFDEKIRAIESKAIENLFGYVLKKLKDYVEEPFSPNIFYNNWKLRITFEAEKIKGKLTVKAGNTILFDQILSREELKDNEIDYLERKYIPEGKDIIIFETPNQKPVVRDVDYSETICTNKKACIFLHNFGNGCARRDLKIAAVQLRYDVFNEDSAVKILDNEAYKQKVMAILEAVKGEADIVVFPEFSIPFDYLEDIQEYANENGIIVFAGTHYITEENLDKYEKLFTSNFAEEDFRKNICPAVIPNSKIIHNEKMFGAKEERSLFFHKGMTEGKLNHIFRLWDNLNLGVLICFEYLNDELRHRLISACDIILVPQTNPNPKRFHETAKSDLNNPLCSGNKACIMANGVFRIGKMENDNFVVGKDEILGGLSGILLTLDKDSNKRLNEGIIYSKEQFVLLATIDLQYSASRDIQLTPEPIKTSVVHIFEEKEIRLLQEENKEEFLAFLGNINACTGRKELKNLIENNRFLIEKFSPLMHKHTENLNNLDFDEIKEKCQLILISDNKENTKSHF